MKKIQCILLLTLLAAFVLTGCGADSGTVSEESQNQKDTYKIYLITKWKNAPFWEDLNEGCQQAAKELGNIEYKWTAPEKAQSPLQGKCVDEAVAEGANAILISSLSLTDLSDNFAKADEAGVKIIYVDSASDYPATASLMTDNIEAGREAGEAMLKALTEAGVQSGTIGVASDYPDTVNTDIRNKSFRDVFAGTDFTVAPSVYAGSDPQVAKDALKAHPEYVGFFATNQVPTTAVCEYVKETPSQTIYITFDAAENTLAMIKEGKIYATIQQNGKEMGHKGVDIAVQALNGTLKEKGIRKDIGVNIITKDNLPNQ